MRVHTKLFGPVRSEDTDALAEEVSRVLDERLAALPPTVPGVVFLVRLASGREILRCAGRGALPTRTTLFQVMSISKPVAAFGVLRLGEQGVLDLDAPVMPMLRSWSLPAGCAGGFDPRGITIRRILCHCSGLNIHGYGWVEGDARRPTIPELLSGMDGPASAMRLVQEPGARSLYSGGAYTLLQQVVEDVTGRGFAEAMRDAVLAPVGMDHSTFDDQDPMLSGLAVRHDADGRPLPPARIASPCATGLYTCAEDLVRFLGALVPGRRGGPPGCGVISPASAASMTSTQSSDDQGHRWANGFYLMHQGRETIIHHGGFKLGWWNQVDGLVRAGHVMATLCNGDAGATHVKPIAAEVRDLMRLWDGRERAPESN